MPCKGPQKYPLCCELLCRPQRIAPAQRAPPALPGRRAAVDLTSSRVPAANKITNCPLPFHFLAGGTSVTCTARGKSRGPKPGAWGERHPAGRTPCPGGRAAGGGAAGAAAAARRRPDRTPPPQQPTAHARRAQVRHSSSGCCGRQHGSTTARRRTCGSCSSLWPPNCNRLADIIECSKPRARRGPQGAGQETGAAQGHRLALLSLAIAATCIWETSQLRKQVCKACCRLHDAQHGALTGA